MTAPKQEVEEVDEEIASCNSSDYDVDDNEDKVVNTEMSEATKAFNAAELLDINHVTHGGTPACPIHITAHGMVDVARIVEGGSFGDNALTDGKPRLCMTRCITRCHLLVMHVDDWKLS